MNYKFAPLLFVSMYDNNPPFSSVDESILTTARVGKLRCIHHYLKRVASKMPTGALTFSRRQAADCPAWEHSSAAFTKLHASSEGTIEEHGLDMLQVYYNTLLPSSEYL